MDTNNAEPAILDRRRRRRRRRGAATALIVGIAVGVGWLTYTSHSDVPTAVVAGVIAGMAAISMFAQVRWL